MCCKLQMPYVAFCLTYTFAMLFNLGSINVCGKKSLCQLGPGAMFTWCIFLLWYKKEFALTCHAVPTLESLSWYIFFELFWCGADFWNCVICALEKKYLQGWPKIKILAGQYMQFAGNKNNIGDNCWSGIIVGVKALLLVRMPFLSNFIFYQSSPGIFVTEGT